MKKNNATNIDKFVQMIVKSADESKAESITWIDIRNENFPVRKVVMITALNSVHLRAVAESLYVETKEQIRAAGDEAELLEPFVSGTSDSGWIVLDFGSLAVHVITQELRRYYELDAFFEKQGVVYHHE